MNASTTSLEIISDLRQNMSGEVIDAEHYLLVIRDQILSIDAQSTALNSVVGINHMDKHDTLNISIHHSIASHGLINSYACAKFNKN